MYSSSTHIRKLIPDKNQEGITDEERRIIDEQHRFVFFVVGMSVYPNSDISLLTQKLFRCQNFANDCMLYHNILLTILSLMFSIFFESLDFNNLIYSIWGALLCHISHILISIFGNGIHARNLFIVVFAVMGALRAVLVFSCPTVISQLFSITTFVLLNNSRSASALILGFFQGVLNNIIGFNTVYQARLNLILCISFQALITLFGAVWITLLYFQHGHKVRSGGFTPDKTVKDTIMEKINNFGYIKYYFSRFALYHLGSFKYFFHPGLIPYLLECPIPTKLKGSVIYTLSEFLGRNSALAIDETIYAKPGSHTEPLLLALRDIPMFFLIFSVIILNSTILYSTFSGKQIFVKSSGYLYICLSISGLVYGYIITRGTTGSKAIIEHYRKKKGSDNLPPDASKNVSEVLTMSYYCTLIIPYIFSKSVQYLLKRSRLSRQYILTRKFGNLSPEDVKNLYSQFQ
ncbi:conserved hypothetical protein [Theileria orientalis strain Shintoku]|uniref:Nucleoside transporter n=1 Tax=Theileria orientalis strain Shintoku TaxID=869250 RepID=J4CDQ2_THEOR|nr:conserved hypothetical protein [Theileria orientalis strain Shintoku]PVC50384.1 hypothetical protein MACL_00002314 [Theileria orientalis]BAM41537.1 conserved hypothetical protein [Theileria orientalis strain Shintoku]|eukprot:XP_009691838.1 conserved hypothetical protein [Theileria orientalis strain Shintoku]